MSERTRIQRKLEKVTTLPSGQNDVLQRSSTASEKTMDGALSLVQEALSSIGHPLDTNTERFMESRLGHDFSQVRVHTDERAVESAEAVNALAYTVGTDIIFDRGQYAPGTLEGKHLLAHELTHVIQQGSGQVISVPMSNSLSISDPADSLECAAGETAGKVMAGSQYSTQDMQEASSRTSVPHSGIAVQRFQAGETGHGGIEEKALTGTATGLPANLQFSSAEVSKIYLGNWLRDLSQLPTWVLPLINILALGEFGREITQEDLGTYIPSEHLDNPEGGRTVEDQRLSEAERQKKRDDELSSAQKSAFDDEKAHMADIQNAARESGLPVYIERGKFHAKRELTEAINLGRTDAGMREMGNALHAVEDYYSHSNFVEVALWYLQTKNELPSAQYNQLVTTELRHNAAFMGDMSVPQGGPEIVTGSYAPGGNYWVSRVEMICTEIEQGQLSAAFVKGALLKLAISPVDIVKKVVEFGDTKGRSYGKQAGGVVGGVIGAAGEGLWEGITGAGHGAAEGWREHSGLSAVWHGFTGLFSGAAKGAAEGASEGWQAGQEVGASVGGAIGGFAGSLVGLGVGGLVDLLGPPVVLALFPVITALRAALLVPVRAGLGEAIAKTQVKRAESEAQAAHLHGPTHAELAKDDPKHHLFKIANSLAVTVDKDIGNAMAKAWEETKQRDEFSTSSQPPTPEVVASVTGLVDKYISHPATDLWWYKIVSDEMTKATP
jgi:hypothetical protein